MKNFNWEPLFLSTKIAMITTLILLLISIPLIFCVHFYSFKSKPFLKALISLPLVLPPSVLGYYLLVAFNPEGIVGSFTDKLFNIRLVFSFTGILIGSIIFSFPFMINPIISGLENLPSSLQEASYTLGKSKWQTYLKVLLPNASSSLWIAIAMTFAHTMGEFGVVLIIGGNIPGETRMASIAIYNELEALNYYNADLYSAILMGFSFLILIIVYVLQGSKTLKMV